MFSNLELREWNCPEKENGFPPLDFNHESNIDQISELKKCSDNVMLVLQQIAVLSQPFVLHLCYVLLNCITGTPLKSKNNHMRRIMPGLIIDA